MTAGCPTCGRGGESLEHLLAEERIDRQGAENEVKRLRRENGRLKRELAERTQKSPTMERAQRLYDQWHSLLGKNANTVFDPARQKLLVGMLEMYDQRAVDGDALMAKAIKGLAKRPYVGASGRVPTGTKRQRYDDLKYAVQNAESVERFGSYCDEDEASREKRYADARDDMAVVYGTDTATGETRWQGTAVWPDVSRHPGGVELLFERLGDVAVRGQSPKWMVQCPAHDDRDPSLSIFEKPDGRVLIHCFAGCKPLDVLQAVGLEFADIGGPCAVTDEIARRWAA